MAIIVAVKGNVQLAIPWHHLFIELFESLHQKIREQGTPVLDTDQTGILKIAVVFDQLVTKSVDREQKSLFIDYKP